MNLHTLFIISGLRPLILLKHLRHPISRQVSLARHAFHSPAFLYPNLTCSSKHSSNTTSLRKCFLVPRWGLFTCLPPTLLFGDAPLVLTHVTICYVWLVFPSWAKSVAFQHRAWFLGEGSRNISVKGTGWALYSRLGTHWDFWAGKSHEETGGSTSWLGVFCRTQMKGKIVKQ